jgi:branched-chain amino acid transport system permease protein
MVDLLSLIVNFASFYGIYAILALSLNLEYGYGGQPNFGQALFYGVGAFTGAIVAANLLPLFARVPIGNICDPNTEATRVLIASTEPTIGIPVWVLVLIIATAAGGLFGFFLSYPAIRIKEEWYLSMILLVASEAFIVVIENTPQFGCGIFGLVGIQNPFTWITDSFRSSSFANSVLGIDLPGLVYAIIIIAFTGVCYLIAKKLTNSPYGRLLKSIRDDKIASESLGKDVAKVRRQIMIIGSMMAGLAGGLYVFFIGTAVPDDYVPALTFAIWVMMILGGYANNRGVLAGALVLTLLQRGTFEAGIIVQNQIPNFNPEVLIYLQYVIQAVILILLLMFRPKGLVPEKRIETKAYELFDFSKKEAASNKVLKEESEIEKTALVKEKVSGDS